MKNKKNAQKTKTHNSFMASNGSQFSTAMLSLSLAFLLIIGFAVGGMFTALASAEITSDSIGDSSIVVPASQTTFQEITSGSSEAEPISVPDPEPDPVPEQVLIDTAEIAQKPELPSGCEITSLTAALFSCGYNVDKTTMANDYLPQSESYWGADPEKIYMGNPAHSTANTDNGPTQGWYCYEEPILEAANSYLAEQGSFMSARAENLSREAFIEKLAGGTPIVSWITTNMAAPQPASTVGWNDENGSWFAPYVNVHCVLVIGYNLSLNEVAIMDPLVGFRTENMDTFFSVYEMMGSRSLTIEYD